MPFRRAGETPTNKPLLREHAVMATPGRHVSRLSGFAPAVPTPFDENGAIDRAAFERFCDRQIDEGATALVVCGTTGEAPTLSPEEHTELIRHCGRRLPVGGYR